MAVRLFLLKNVIADNGLFQIIRVAADALFVVHSEAVNKPKYPTRSPSRASPATTGVPTACPTQSGSSGR